MKVHITLASAVLAGGLLLSGMAQAHEQYTPGFGGVVQAQHHQYRGYQPVNYGYQNAGYQYGRSDQRYNNYGHHNGYDRGHHYGYQRGHHYGHQQYRHHGHHHR